MSNSSKSHSKMKSILLLPLLLLCIGEAHAQNTSNQTRHIAVLTPFYLDSAFDASGQFRFGKTLPSYLNPGMETYLGIQLAIDSLQKTGVAINVHIYDTKSATQSVENLIRNDSLNQMSFIVGYFNLNESAMIAKFAAAREIPTFNINLPNDAGINKNEYYSILNPTLNTHCNGLYQFLLKNYNKNPILYFRKKGMMEDKLQQYFKEAAVRSSSTPLKFRTVMLEDSLSTEQLKLFLDSTKNTVCIIGSLESTFSLQLCKQLATLRANYNSTIVGMPTWEQFDFTKPAYKGAEIIYSTASYIRPDNKLAQQITQQFKEKYFMKTSDLSFRALEVFLFLTRSSEVQTGKALMLSLLSNQSSLWGSIDLRPVIQKESGAIEYFENKKLYYIRKNDGVIKAVY